MKKQKTKSQLAKEQALKDIREDLKKSGKLFIAVSVRQLRVYNSLTKEV